MTGCIRLSGIVDGTSVDGPGLRTSIYTSGCMHRCPGCHNEHTWPFDAGEDYTFEEILARIDYNGFNVTFSGGDPMYRAAELLPLMRAVKERGRNIWCYTGFTFEQLAEVPGAMDLLRYIDVLVDGPYVAALRDTDLRFRGSSNQRIIDVPASLAAGRAVILQM